MVEERRNERGETLAEFLAAYDPAKYERPSVTVDMAVLTTEGEALLIRRRDHPNIGMWALPGGFLNMDESLYAAAARELEEETSVIGAPLLPLGMYGEPTRDPRTRIITCAFCAVIGRDSLRFAAGDDAADAALFTVQCRAAGEVCVERQQLRGTKVALPCAACGTPKEGPAKGFELRLTGRGEAEGVRLGARCALCDGGQSALLGPIEGLGEIAGDHALILFDALRSAGFMQI